MKHTVLLVCAAVLALSACNRGRPAPAPEEREQIPVSPRPDAAAPAFPEGGEARLEYREGSVEVLRGADVLGAEPGAALALGDRIRTGADGEAEIRLGALAGVRLLPGSEAELRSARLAPGAAHVEVFLASGTALFDVRALGAGESFVASAPRLLTGVRGTRFLVAAAGGDSTAAVREGRVAVLPRGPVLERLASAARTNAVARQALRAVVALAPTAGPGQVIRVDDGALARAEAAYADLESRTAALPEVPLDAGFPEDPWFASAVADLPVPDAAAEASYARIRDAAASVRSGLAVPVSAGPETLKSFERFRDFRSGPYSPAPAAPSQPPSVLGRTALSARPVAGSLVRVPDGDALLAADESGGLFGFSPEGRILWSLRTGNRGTPRSYPVTYKGVAYYAGDVEILAVDGATGAVLARRPLDPGRDPEGRPAPFPDSILLASQTGIDVLDPRTLETRRSIPVAAGPGTLPIQRDSFALVVDKDGTLLLVDPVSGTVTARAATGARGASAVSPRIFEGKACFADRSGLVVMVDLERMEVLWERRTGVPVLTDIEIAREGVLVYGNGTLFGYRLDGEALMAPVSGVSAPPLLSRGSVYFGTERGELVAAQASPWRIRSTVPLGDVPSARPLQVGDTLYIGTRGGRLVRIDVTKLAS